MRSRAVAIGGVVASMLVLIGACGSDESQRAPGSLGRSAQETEAPPEDTKPSIEETTDPSPNDADKQASQAATVKVIDTDFRPVKLVVTVGTTVEWKQIGDQPHSVTAADDSFDSNPDCGPLDSDKCLGEGDRFTHTFDQAGEFTYYCRVHGLPDGTGMVGTIVVK